MTPKTISETIKPLKIAMPKGIASSSKDNSTNQETKPSNRLQCLKLVSDAIYDSMLVLSFIFLLAVNVTSPTEHKVKEVTPDFLGDLACQVAIFVVAWIWKKNFILVSMAALVGLWVFSAVCGNFWQVLSEFPGGL